MGRRSRILGAAVVGVRPKVDGLTVVFLGLQHTLPENADRTPAQESTVQRRAEQAREKSLANRRLQAAWRDEDAAGQRDSTSPSVDQG